MNSNQKPEYVTDEPRVLDDEQIAELLGNERFDARFFRALHPEAQEAIRFYAYRRGLLSHQEMGELSIAIGDPTYGRKIPQKIIGEIRGRMFKNGIGYVSSEKAKGTSGEKVPRVENLSEAVYDEMAETKPDPCDAKWNGYLNSLNLSNSAMKKLQAMMSPASYRGALETAKDLDSTGLFPPKAQIVQELMKYPPERLNAICDMMEQPTLLIVPVNGFDEKITAMNEHRHFINARGKRQKNVDVYGSCYKNAPKMKKGKVSIVEAIVHPEQPANIPDQLATRREYYTQKFATAKMRHIDKDEMAALFQKSLREARKANDESLIVDTRVDGNGTSTFIDPESLIKSSLVAYANFDLNENRIGFYEHCTTCGALDLRGRAAIEVLEF